MYFKVAIGILAVIITSGSALAQVPPAPPPAIFPDPVEEPPADIIRPDYFYNYSWRSFIALNWPAQIGAASRGLPDRERAFGDTNGPRVWMTWKSRYEIFQPMGALPSPWASYEGKNPCGGEGFDHDVVTLSSFSAFHDFDQAGLGFNPGNPLVAQNGTYVRYEVRVNEPEFDSIVGHKWYIATNLPTSATPPVPFNIGSTAVKAAWRILNKKDTPANRRRYYVTRAKAFDVALGECTSQEVALVGFHIVTKTRERPQWIWSTFEHIDNVPGVRGIKNQETVPFSFNDPYQPQKLPKTPPDPISPDHPPSADPSPTQVVRDPDAPIERDAMRKNTEYWNLPEIKGTVWQNYVLVMTQWPSEPKKPEFAPFPEPKTGSALSNTTMETYIQDGPGCMGCHRISNENGRDFAMFVTIDAFQPGVLTPGDLFNAKNARSSDGSVKPESALSSDPMLKSLKQFFKAIGPK